MTALPCTPYKHQIGGSDISMLKGKKTRSYLKLSTAVYRRVAEYCDDSTRRKLAQVSQSWRILVSPFIWESVYIYDYPDCGAAAKHIHSLYQTHVKHLYLQSRHTRRSAPSWIDSPAEVAIIGAWLEVEWPNLESLLVRFLFTPVDIRIIDIGHYMPQLTTLTVENSYLPWRDVAKWAMGATKLNDLSLSYTKDVAESDQRRFAHLLGDYNVLQSVKGDGFSRLRIQYQPDELGVFYASILRTQTMLRELRIDHIPADHVEALSRQLSYPSSLETLCLGIDNGDSVVPLTCLTPRALPKLSRLMIRCSSTPIAQCDIVLAEFMRHDWPLLRGLIVSSLTNNQCERLVAICPSLEVLMVQPVSPAEDQIHNSGLECMLKGMRQLRRLHVVQQISPLGEMLTENFIWKATRFDPPRMFSLRKTRRWESWAPKLASSPWLCANLHDLSLCGVYLSFPALIQLLSTLPFINSLKVSIRGGSVGTVITSHMFEPWGRHSCLRFLTIDDINEGDLPHLRKLCEYMPLIKQCRIMRQKQSDGKQQQQVVPNAQSRKPLRPLPSHLTTTSSSLSSSASSYRPLSIAESAIGNILKK